MTYPSEWFCTKKRNERRFPNGEQEGRLIVKRYVYDEIGITCRVKYLREADGARAECAAVGQIQYDPTLDIDRYVVECSRVNRYVDRCAVFERVKVVIEAQCLHAIGLKKDGVDANDPALIRGGDGYMGMIADMMDAECSFLPSDGDLAEICKGCKHRCDDAAQRRHERNHKIKVKRSHGGIIPFLKRLFGRKATTGGARQ